MSNKKLTILGIVAALMVIWAIMQSRISSKVAAEPSKPAYLIQGLNPAQIGAITVESDKNKVTLKLQSGHFVVAEKDNYPAKTSEINTLLTKCLEIQSAQFITDNPANFDDLGVTEEKAHSVIKFFTPEPNSTLLAGLIIGNTRQVGGGTYVRLLSSDQPSSNKVYIAPIVPSFATEATNYIEQELTYIKPDDIESVTITTPDGEYSLKAKQDSKEIILENIPAGKKLKSSEARKVFIALSNLRFDDVRKYSEGMTFDNQCICQLKNSTVYTIKIAKKDDKSYISCQATFTDVVTKPTKDDSEEQLKKKEAQLLAWEKTNQFSEKHNGWLYQTPDWEAKLLTKKLSELLEDEEPNAIELEDINTPKTNNPIHSPQ